MQKQTVIFEENPKWWIYKGKFVCQIGSLSRDRARILYLIVLWPTLKTLDFALYIIGSTPTFYISICI